MTWWSGIQALYFCVPFRDQLLEYCGQNKTIGETTEENLLTCLSELFTQVSSLSFDLRLREQQG